MTITDETATAAAFGASATDRFRTDYPKPSGDGVTVDYSFVLDLEA